MKVPEGLTVKFGLADMKTLQAEIVNCHVCVDVELCSGFWCA